MDQGSSLDLNTRKVSRPAARTNDSIERGVPSPDALTSAMMMRGAVPPDET